MARWGHAVWLCALLLGRASAQPEGAASVDISELAAAPDPPPAPLELGYAALPGGIQAASALTLPKGTFTVATLGGFGWRGGLLPTPGDTQHRFGRGIGNLAFAYAPHDLITVALTLDGRYDRHFGVPRSGDGGKEDGYVGDPRVIVRASKPVGSLTFGGQLGIWVPGKDAPSIAGSAISVDARALISLPAGPGVLSFNAGFRLDQSHKSVVEPEQLSPADRISLGVSEFHAAVAGAHLSIPVGRAFVGAETGVDLFVGSDAPGPIVRGALHAGLHVTPQWSVLAFVQLAKVPAIDPAGVMENVIPLIPYEPTVTGGLGIQGRFGGTRRRGDAHITKNATPTDVAIIELAEVAGVVTDDAGRPIVGARVTITLKNHTGTGATDDKGSFTIANLPIGKTVGGATTLDDTAAEVSIEVAGKKPFKQTLTLAKGPNAVTKLTLEPLLPPGQLRAVLRMAASGKPIPGGTVTIEPSGSTTTAAADGTISIDLPPGAYKATASAPGFKPQTLDVVVDPNGVAVKNFELVK